MNIIWIVHPILLFGLMESKLPRGHAHPILVEEEENGIENETKSPTKPTKARQRISTEEIGSSSSSKKTRTEIRANQFEGEFGRKQQKSLSNSIEEESEHSALKSRHDEEELFTIEKPPFNKKANVYEEEFNEEETDLSLHSTGKTGSRKPIRVTADEEAIAVEPEASFEEASLSFESPPFAKLSDSQIVVSQEPTKSPVGRTSRSSTSHQQNESEELHSSHGWMEQDGEEGTDYEEYYNAEIARMGDMEVTSYIEDTIKDTFDMMDLNNDGKISTIEAQSIYSTIDMSDGSADGKINIDSYSQAPLAKDTIKENAIEFQERLEE